MVNYACAFSQSESGKYFEWIIMYIKVVPSICHWVRGTVNFGDQHKVQII